MYKYQHEELALPENRNWPLKVADGGLSKSEKRMHTVRWMAKAWGEFKQNEQHNCTSAFVGTGVLIAKDGSEDHLIRLWPKALPGMYVY